MYAFNSTQWTFNLCAVHKCTCAHNRECVLRICLCTESLAFPIYESHGAREQQRVCTNGGYDESKNSNNYMVSKNLMARIFANIMRVYSHNCVSSECFAASLLCLFDRMCVYANVEDTLTTDCLRAAS